MRKLHVQQMNHRARKKERFIFGPPVGFKVKVGAAFVCMPTYTQPSARSQLWLTHHTTSGLSWNQPLTSRHFASRLDDWSGLGAEKPEIAGLLGSTRMVSQICRTDFCGSTAAVQCGPNRTSAVIAEETLPNTSFHHGAHSRSKHCKSHHDLALALESGAWRRESKGHIATWHSPICVVPHVNSSASVAPGAITFVGDSTTEELSLLTALAAGYRASWDARIDDSSSFVRESRAAMFTSASQASSIGVIGSGEIGQIEPWCLGTPDKLYRSHGAAGRTVHVEHLWGSGHHCKMAGPLASSTFANPEWRAAVRKVSIEGTFGGPGRNATASFIPRNPTKKPAFLIIGVQPLHEMIFCQHSKHCKVDDPKQSDYADALQKTAQYVRLLFPRERVIFVLTGAMPARSHRIGKASPVMCNERVVRWADAASQTLRAANMTVLDFVRPALSWMEMRTEEELFRPLCSTMTIHLSCMPNSSEPMSRNLLNSSVGMGRGSDGFEHLMAQNPQTVLPPGLLAVRAIWAAAQIAVGAKGPVTGR